MIAIRNHNIKKPDPDKPINFFYYGGLGDVVLSAHALPSWIKRGYRFQVQSENEGKDLVWASAGAEIIPKSYIRYAFSNSPERITSVPWVGNKLGWNLNRYPLPQIESKEILWKEACECKLSLPIPSTDLSMFSSLVPFIAIHPRGFSSGEKKNFPHNVVQGLTNEIVRRTHYNILFLDWEGLTNVGNNSRVHYLDKLKLLSIPELKAVLDMASCLVGCDSGILHFVRFTDCPALGLWYGTSPESLALPRPLTTHLTLHSFTKEGFGIVRGWTDNISYILEWIQKIIRN